MISGFPFNSRKEHLPLSGSDSPVLCLLITALFCAWCLLRLPYHEMWRDEVGLWLDLVHTGSIPVLLGNIDYGGHPVLWPILLYPLAQLSSDPLIMQGIHIACATASAFLILRYAPFTFPEKMLLVFSYYLSFEYALITRHYALSVLLLLGYLSLRTAHRSSALPAAICLALLAETNVFGTILAIALLCGWIMEQTQSIEDYDANSGRGPGWLAAAVVIAGIIIAVIDMKPPPDYIFARKWFFILDSGRLMQTLALIWNALFPIPEFQPEFWNSNILSAYPLISAFSGVILFCICLWSFRREKTVSIALTIAFAGLLAFYYLKYTGYLRHHGFLFLAVLSCYWLYRNRIRERTQVDRIFRTVIWMPMLLIHVSIALYASYMDYKLPFSGSKDAVEYLYEHNLQNRPLAVYPLERVKPIALLLNRGLYHLASESIEKYAVFNKSSYIILTKQEIVDRARKRLAETDGQSVFILSDRFTLPQEEFRLLDQVPETAIVGSERYNIYIGREITTQSTIPKYQ